MPTAKNIASTGMKYRTARGARLVIGGPIMLWIGWNCFTGNTLAEAMRKVDTFLMEV